MELNTSHGNANETDNKNSKSNKLIEQNPIPETPFTAVKYDDKWYLTMGKYRLTEALDTENQVIEDATRADWWRVMQVMNIMLDERIEQLKNNLNK